MKYIHTLFASALLATTPLASSYLGAEEPVSSSISSSDADKAPKAPSKIELASKKFTDGSTIKVLIAHKVTNALLEVKGGYKVYKARNGALLSFGHVGKRFVVYPMLEGIRWGEEYPDIYQISIVPDDENTTIFVNGIQYKGALNVYQYRNKISIVNEVDIEDYTKAVLGPLFDTALEPEAMAALAITCRTQAYHQVISSEKENLNQGLWHITQEEAKYFGYGVTGRSNGVDEAVESTRHIVMEQVSEKSSSKDNSTAIDKDDKSEKSESSEKSLTSKNSHALPLTFAAGWNATGLSIAQSSNLKNIPSASQLSLSYAQDMAKKGHDAKRILYTTFSNTKISVVNKPIQETLR